MIKKLIWEYYIEDRTEASSMDIFYDQSTEVAPPTYQVAFSETSLDLSIVMIHFYTRML